MLILLQILFVIFRPAYWVKNYPYSKQPNRELLDILNNGEYFTEIGEYTAKFGRHTLWIRNHPFASFTIRGKEIIGMPSGRTRKLLMKRLQESHFNNL